MLHLASILPRILRCIQDANCQTAVGAVGVAAAIAAVEFAVKIGKPVDLGDAVYLLKVV